MPRHTLAQVRVAKRHSFCVKINPMEQFEDLMGEIIGIVARFVVGCPRMFWALIGGFMILNGFIDYGLNCLIAL